MRRLKHVIGADTDKEQPERLNICIRSSLCGEHDTIKANESIFI